MDEDASRNTGIPEIFHLPVEALLGDSALAKTARRLIELRESEQRNYAAHGSSPVVDDGEERS